MMNCQQATRLMSDAQERRLSRMQRLSLKMHVSMCSGCRNFSRQMGSLRAISQAYSKGSIRGNDVAPDSQERSEK